MASKRSMKKDTVEDLAKKIKLEQKRISEKINKDYPDMDITDHEINKFVLIIHTLLKTSSNKDKFSEILAVDTEDDVQDTIMLIVTKLLNLLKGNFDSLNLPKKVKSGLKKLKSILFLISKVDGKDKDGSKDGNRPEETTDATTGTLKSSST